MQQDEHRGLVAGVKPNWLPDGAREAGDGLLRNQVCGCLVTVKGLHPYQRQAKRLRSARGCGRGTF